MCNAEAASVEAVAQQYGPEVRFVGVAWSGTTDEYQAFVDTYALTFPQIDDTAGTVFARFGLVSQPGAVVVAADGTSQTLRGRADGEAIAAAVETALSTG